MRMCVHGKKAKTVTNMILSVCLLLLNSCVTYYPQAVDIPLIKEKGDARLDAGMFLIPALNTVNESDSNIIADMGINATFTSGITDILAVQAFLSFDVLSRIHIQGALGVYKAFENKTVMELYGGFGYGNSIWSSAYNESRDDYLLTFAQYNLGQTGLGKSNIDFGMGLKGGYLQNNSVTDDFYKKNGWMMEPSVFFRFGSNRAKYNVKVIYLWTDTVAEKYYFPLSVSMGVNFHVGRRTQK